MKLFSPKLYIISLACLGFEITLLKGANLQLDRKSTHLPNRGGRSHFSRLRLPSCSKILESGSGYSSNL